MPAAKSPANWHEQHRILTEDGWRRGNDNLWRNDRFGGSYKTANALKRIRSRHGEVTGVHQLALADAGARMMAEWPPIRILSELSAALDRRPRGRVERQDKVVHTAIARLPKRAGQIATGIWVIISMRARRQSLARMFKRIVVSIEERRQDNPVPPKDEIQVEICNDCGGLVGWGELRKGCCFGGMICRRERGTRMHRVTIGETTGPGPRKR